MEYTSTTPINVTRFINDPLYRTIPMTMELSRRHLPMIQYANRHFFEDKEFAEYALTINSSYVDTVFPYNYYDEDFYINWAKKTQKYIHGRRFIRDILTPNIAVQMVKNNIEFFWQCGITSRDSDFWSTHMIEFLFFERDNSDGFMDEYVIHQIPEEFQTRDLWLRLIKRHVFINNTDDINIELDQEIIRAINKNKLLCR